MTEATLKLEYIDIDQIRPNPFQPREHFEKESLQELADSIKNGGIIQPIVVRKQGANFEIVAGERRWRATRMANVKRIPAIIKDIAENKILLESLVENLHRLDLTDIERENAVHELWKQKEVLGFKTKSDMAKSIGVTIDDVEHDLDGWAFRHEEGSGIPESTPTYMITRTKGLPTEERKRVIEKVDKGELQAKDAYTTIKVIRKASDSMKRELLKPKSHITPKMAETIVEKLPSREDQEAVLKETIQHRLTEDEVVARVQDIKRSRESGVEPTIERQVIIKGQWLVDGVSKPANDLLSINVDAISDLNEKQKEEMIKLLTKLSNKVNEWLVRLKGVKTIDMR